MSQHDPEGDLSRALHRRVDSMHAAPLGLDDVAGRARVIRRRRRVAVGAGVAAALVVVVPTALVAAGGLDRTAREPQPAVTSTPTATESPAPTATPAPSPSGGSAPFDVSDLPTGVPPAIEWSDGRDVHRADGSVAADVLPAGVDGFAPMGDAWVVSSRDDQGAIVRLVGGAGIAVAQVYDLDGDLATSPDGAAVAWAEPDGGVRVVQREGDEQVELPAIGDVSGPYDAVAVSSEDCQEGGSSDAGCTVFVNAIGEQAQTWASTSLGFSERYDEEVQRLTAWSSVSYAGITAVNDDLTTCSAVRDPATLSTVWKTCDHRLLAYSPDAAHLLGVGSIGSGFADGQVAILDATDGTVLVDLRSDEQHQTGALQLTWEDDSHALVVTYADGKWAVVRLGLDGSAEYAVPPRAGDQFERPFILQS